MSMEHHSSFRHMTSTRLFMLRGLLTLLDGRIHSLHPPSQSSPDPRPASTQTELSTEFYAHYHHHSSSLNLWRAQISLLGPKNDNPTRLNNPSPNLGLSNNPNSGEVRIQTYPSRVTLIRVIHHHTIGVNSDQMQEQCHSHDVYA